MKFVVFDWLYDTEKFPMPAIQNLMQGRLDDWLGKDTVKVKATLQADNIMDITLTRKFGDWFEDPRRYTTYNESIFSYDEQYFLGLNYQTGTYADLSIGPERYLIWDDLKSMFLPDMKVMARRNHGSRIKDVSINYQDCENVTLRIELLKPKRKPKVSSVP